MNIVFITNAGNIKEIGSGHIYRSIFIAKLIKQNNKKINIIFFTKKK